ncbi:NmrA family NAD(P)-binding protein [Spirosoma horti]
MVDQGDEVRILVRPSSSPATLQNFEKQGVQVVRITTWAVPELTEACRGISCFVSALSGLRETVIDAQQALLDAAVAAGVPRFIPSDYSIDFTRFQAGRNRNLDLRREFHVYLDRTPTEASRQPVGRRPAARYTAPGALHSINEVARWAPGLECCSPRWDIAR